MKSWLLPAVASVLLYGLWSFFPKLTVRYLSPASAVMWEVAGSLVFGAIVFVMMGLQVQYHPRGALFGMLTGFCLVLAGFTYLVAASRGPVALVSTVSSLYPVITIVLASLILGETITLRQGCGIVLAMIAVVLMAG